MATPLAQFMADCKECGRRTSTLEAMLRKFNTGLCGRCGGELVVINPPAPRGARQWAERHQQRAGVVEYTQPPANSIPPHRRPIGSEDCTRA